MNCVRCEIRNAKVAVFVMRHVQGKSDDEVIASLNERYKATGGKYWKDREGFLRRSPSEAVYYMGVGIEVAKLNAT